MNLLSNEDQQEGSQQLGERLPVRLPQRQSTSLRAEGAYTLLVRRTRRSATLSRRGEQWLGFGG